MRRILAHFGGEFRRHILAEQLGDLALAAGCGKKTVGGVERIQAEQRQHRRRHRHHPKARPRRAVGGQQQGQQRNAGRQANRRPERSSTAVSNAPSSSTASSRASFAHGGVARVVPSSIPAIRWHGSRPRKGVGKWRHAQIGQPRRSRAQQHDAVFQLCQRRLPASTCAAVM